MMKHPRDSEKWLERTLTDRVAQSGGLALKYASSTTVGFPDRLLLWPNGVAMWAEIKSRGKRPTAMQQHRIRQLREMGFKVWVVDSEAVLEEAVAHGVAMSAARSGHTDTSSGQ